MRKCALAIVLLRVSFSQPALLRDISPHRAGGEISILRVDFQELRFGHEGPGYFSVKRAPLRGKQEVAEASLYGQEEIGSVRFELADQSGRTLGVVPAWRTGDGADADEYMLLVDVPDLPFRLRIRGEDSRGRTFQHVFPRLFLPAEGSLRAPEVPAGLDPQQARVLRGMMDDAARQLQGRFEQARREQVDGAIRIPHSGVTGASYERLLSEGGRAIGLRARYTVRFEAAGYYAVSPHVFPVYENPAWRGQIDMKVLAAEVRPTPAPAPGSPVDGIADTLRCGAKAHYEGGVDYHFTFDLAPGYIIRNAEGSRYCVCTESYRAGGRLAVWEAIVGSRQPVKYRVDLPDLDYLGETAPLPGQRVWLESFRREGAADCGPTPTVHF